MPTKKQIGNKAEAIACLFYQQKGYEILFKNWRFKNYEIDLIAKKDNFLAIVEVRSKTNLNYGKPADTISNAKINYLANATEGFLQQHNWNLNVRFDLILITFKSNKQYALNHIENAFWP